MFFYIAVLYSTTLIDYTSSTPSFTPSPTTLRHLAVDPLTGKVYVGAVNHIYQLDSNLTLVVDVVTGPVQDDKGCFFFNNTGHLDCNHPQLKATNNFNQVTVFTVWDFTSYVSSGAPKTRELTTREWTTRHEDAGVSSSNNTLNGSIDIQKHNQHNRNNNESAKPFYISLISSHNSNSVMS